jgi:hypothetical protein
MRDSGARDLFDFERQSNPQRWRRVAFTSDKRGRPIAYLRTSSSPMRWFRIGYDEARLLVSTGRAEQEPYRSSAPRANPDDSAELRYQRAVGHGERPSTARQAARNPGRAVGRMAPNCPSCGALVRLANPPRPLVECAECGQVSMVRRP